MFHYYIGDTMKYIMVILAVIMLPLILNKEIDNETIIIPKESIRIRIIANSNSIEDQYEKNIVRDKVQVYLEKILKNSNSKEETKSIINNNLENINSILDSTLKELSSNNSYNIKLGNNYFPQKEYKGTTYESGFYESLVITLGKGEGINWWCVLFPPLCLMETNEEINESDYKLYILEILKKYQN